MTHPKSPTELQSEGLSAYREAMTTPKTPDAVEESRALCEKKNAALLREVTKARVEAACWRALARTLRESRTIGWPKAFDQATLDIEQFLAAVEAAS